MSRLAEKIARLLALLGLIAAMLVPAVPSTAAVAPTQPNALHATMGCDDAATDSSPGTQQQIPTHLPGAMDCCVANFCAMSLALPASPSGIALSVRPEAATYDLRPLLQPIGIDAAPLPHPPKTVA